MLFNGDVVLLASSNQDLQHAMEQFAAECEAAGIRISNFKSKAMVLNWITWLAPSRSMECPDLK